MSLEKAINIQREFNLDTCTQVILPALEYQYIFNVDYNTALDYVRNELNNRFEYK